MLKDNAINLKKTIDSLNKEVAKRKGLEKKLREANEFNLTILKTIPFAMDIVDEKGNILFLNEKFQAIVGKDTIGKKCWEIYRDDKKQCWNCPLKKGISLHETSIIDSEGVFGGRVFRISHTGMHYQDKLAILEIFQDITKERTIEDGLRKLSVAVEQSPSAVVITDTKGTIEYVNPKFERLTGYALEDVTGKKSSILKSGKQTAEFYKKLWEVIGSGREWRNEFHNRKKDGEFYWESASISPIRDSEGNITHYVKVAEDITARKKAEEELKEALAIKAEFTSMVSHELRTPLAAIKEAIAIVFDEVAGSINKEQKDFLDTAKRNVDRLARLINDVLDFSKLEARAFEFQMEKNDINKLVGEVVKTEAGMARQKGLNLNVYLDERVPKIRFDYDKITQVLANLLSNAIKFTDKGEIAVSTLVKASENHILVSVKDTGKGIKKEDISRLFQKFQQLQSGKDRKTGGTGLGLAICKKIIDQHGGKIWAESEPGKGSIFYFRLPIKERRG